MSSTDQAKYRRTHRVRTGRQTTVPIPTPVLAEAIEREGEGPLARHLGPEMVAAVRAAAGRTVKADA